MDDKTIDEMISKLLRLVDYDVAKVYYGDALERLKVALGCMTTAVESWQAALDAATLDGAATAVERVRDSQAQVAAARRAYLELGPRRGDRPFNDYDLRHLGGFKVGDPVSIPGRSEGTAGRVVELGRDGMHTVEIPIWGRRHIDYRSLKHAAART